MYGHAGFTDGRAETIGATYTAGSTAIGTSITTGGTSNTMGSWAVLGTPSFQYEAVLVSMAGTGPNDYLYDIGVNDGSGNWHVIADRLRIPNDKGADYMQGDYLPLRIKSGQEVGIRAQSTSTLSSIIATLTGFSCGRKGTPGYAQMDLLSGSASSRGTAIDQGATANTKGAWTQLTASTSVEYDALFIAVGTNGDVTRTATNTSLLDIGVGSAGNEYVIVSDLFLRWSSTLDGPRSTVGVMPVGVGAGKRIVARAAGSDTAAGDRTMDVTLHGFVR